jgi:aspartate racemase
VTQPLRIGILGGMGPLAGVHLQRLIINTTPASKDQDHIQVVCFTNPAIPDRTESLRMNGGDAYVGAVIDSIRCLEAAGATHIVIPCNTAHARLADIQRATTLPVLDLVGTAVEVIREEFQKDVCVGLLATEGTVITEVYQQSASGKNFSWVLPNAEEQEKITDVIRNIKAGAYGDIEKNIISLAKALRGKGAQVIILGCTELSLYAEVFSSRTDLPVVDPLRIMAAYILDLAGKGTEQPSRPGSISPRAAIYYPA